MIGCRVNRVSNAFSLSKEMRVVVAASVKLAPAGARRFCFSAVGELLLFYAAERTHRAPGIYSRCEGFQTASWPSHSLVDCGGSERARYDASRARRGSTAELSRAGVIGY